MAVRAVHTTNLLQIYHTIKMKVFQSVEHILWNKSLYESIPFFVYMVQIYTDKTTIF